MNTYRVQVDAYNSSEKVPDVTFTYDIRAYDRAGAIWKVPLTHYTAVATYPEWRIMTAEVLRIPVEQEASIVGADKISDASLRIGGHGPYAPWNVID
ncbi:hypothetical protein [Herbidospora cretacea]|uniref:hypothetical protein n=1 Tax=Herbidospora cretacea TaxID=28444 RepID=UPI000773660C|nr:hypothetical protein [Herbidospora cretacea]